MPILDDEIRNRVEAFVNELSSLIRQAAADAAVSALTGGQASSMRTVSNTKRGPKPGAPKKAGGRIRRNQAQIEQTMSKVLAYVESNSGSRAEKIRAALGLSAPQTADALRRLMGAKSIKSKGERRATAYMKG